ncbi:metallophosphoesterase family protein [Bacillus sp. B-jedd]|uniref:metallophosphoesterase family protein n=1 Tax=Bacillus sp. B-jedd TaxID=1476857 RepID=UPI00051564E7|nr:metallophosphoesterase family protein [Bacillus sp. B-jedd]CEG28776.1 phosphoesterase [Bacillus sp. B-jedd]
MRIGIIADIHGNAPALKSVLDELENKHDVEHIYCLGDMIGIGPDSNEVLDMLFSRNDLSMITGNHDEAILALASGQAYPQSHSHVREHHQWILDRIDRSFIPKLAALPRLINTKIEGTQLLFIHYQIDMERMNVPICEDPFSSIVEPSLENIQSLFHDKQEDVILFGHHHPRHYFKTDNRIYLNPGSLGCSSKPAAPYAIISFKDGKVEVTVDEAPYDNKAFLESYHRLIVPEREFILKVFHGNQI